MLPHAFWLKDPRSPLAECHFLLTLGSLVGITGLTLLYPMETPSRSRRPDPGCNMQKTQPLITTVSIQSIETGANARASAESCMRTAGGSIWPDKRSMG